jgi:iron(III) transport system ATP-binding protein
MIINDLNLEVHEREIVALLGPSGCGKTTLLRAIAGLLPVSSGSICMGDTLLSSAKQQISSEQRNVGMIFQDYALFPHLTVAENIRFGISKWEKIAQHQQVTEMLTLVKLTEFAERYPHELSGGQQQRVAIARALAYQPALLLLDEPFSNIDSQVRTELMAEVRDILKTHGVAAVFVTHSKDEAFVFADRLALFEQGKIAQIGDAQQLYSQPKSKYAATFLGKANFIAINSIKENTVSTAIGLIESTSPLSDFNVLENLADYCLMLRPEQMLISVTEQKIVDEKDKCNQELTIIDAVFAGSHWNYQIQDRQLTDKALAQIYQGYSPKRFELGQQVTLNVIPHDLVLIKN